MLRAFLLCSILLAAAACENTPTEPVEGRFDLVTVNGSSVPTAASFEGLSVTVDSGHVELHQDETFEYFLALTVHPAVGVDTRRFDTFEGSWVRSGNEVQFMTPGGVQTFTGLVDGPDLEITRDDDLFVHRR